MIFSSLLGGRNGICVARRWIRLRPPNAGQCIITYETFARYYTGRVVKRRAGGVCRREYMGWTAIWIYQMTAPSFAITKISRLAHNTLQVHFRPDNILGTRVTFVPIIRQNARYQGNVMPEVDRWGGVRVGCGSTRERSEVRIITRSSSSWTLKTPNPTCRMDKGLVIDRIISIPMMFESTAGYTVRWVLNAIEVWRAITCR